jgi:hypothetical protein
MRSFERREPGFWELLVYVALGAAIGLEAAKRASNAQSQQAELRWRTQE